VLALKGFCKLGCLVIPAAPRKATSVCRRCKRQNSQRQKAPAKGKQRKAKGNSKGQAAKGTGQDRKASNERQKATAKGEQRKAKGNRRHTAKGDIAEEDNAACKMKALTNKRLQCWTRQKLRLIVRPSAALSCQCSLVLVWYCVMLGNKLCSTCHLGCAHTHFSEGFSADPEMMRGVLASSIRMESTSSITQ